MYPPATLLGDTVWFYRFLAWLRGLSGDPLPGVKLCDTHKKNQTRLLQTDIFISPHSGVGKSHIKVLASHESLLSVTSHGRRQACQYQRRIPIVP